MFLVLSCDWFLNTSKFRTFYLYLTKSDWIISYMISYSAIDADWRGRHATSYIHYISQRIFVNRLSPAHAPFWFIISLFRFSPPCDITWHMSFMKCWPWERRQRKHEVKASLNISNTEMFIVSVKTITAIFRFWNFRQIISCSIHRQS